MCYDNEKESSDFMIQPPQFMPEKEMSKVGGSLWLYIIMQLCLSFGLSFIVTPIVFYTIGFDFSLVNIVVSTVVSLVSGLILLFFMNSTFKMKIRQFKFSFKPKETIDTIGMMYFFNYVIGVIGSLLSRFGLPDTSPDLWLNSDLLYDVFIFISVVILAPIFEELIFRGMILRTLSKYNEIFAIIVTSLLFGLLHLNLTQAVPAFFMSLVLCYMSLKSDSLLVTILAHAANNLLALLSTYFENNIGITIIVLAFVIYGLITLVLRSKEMSAYILEEKTSVNWYAKFFKRVPNLLYLIFTIGITLIRNMIM